MSEENKFQSLFDYVANDSELNRFSKVFKKVKEFEDRDEEIQKVKEFNISNFNREVAQPTLRLLKRLPKEWINIQAPDAEQLEKFVSLHKEKIKDLLD